MVGVGCPAIIGVDPAEASLHIARTKPAADRVRWIAGDATVAASQLPARSIDMAIMTGNVAQVFLGDDWDDTLRAIHRMLRSGGRFVFETRDPAYRGWQEWRKARTRTTIHSPTHGSVEAFVELTNLALPFVSFRWSYLFESDGAELYSDSTLRFRDRDEIDQSLFSAGFTVDDVRDAPDRPGKELVYIASTTDGRAHPIK